MIRTLPFLLLLAACPPPEPPVPGDFKPEGEVLVTVDGNPVTQGMVDATLEQLPPQLKKQLEDAGQMSQVQEQIVSTELLYREALKRKLHEKDAVKVTLALSTRSALADAMIDSIVDERSTEERINKVYSESPKYKLEQVNLRVIAVETEEAANEVKGLVEGGGDFAKLAMERSKDPRSATKGGEIGWVSRRDLQGAFAPAVFSANGGDVVGPFQAGPGFIIFKIDEKRAQIPLEDVKDEIKDGLKESIVVEYIEELKAAATITEAGGTDGSDSTDDTDVKPAPSGASGTEAGGK
ncbi:MAG: peptidylprolyl isomerase [Myxococcota bacterium]